jgi:hypothetical protein
VFNLIAPVTGDSGLSAVVPDGITIEDPVNVALFATAAAAQDVDVPSVCKNLFA